MPFECAIHPRHDLSGAECKVIGQAIYDWLYADQSNRWVDWFGMDDLRSGELPKPLYLRKLTGAEGRGLSEEELRALGDRVRDLSPEEREEMRRGLGEMAHSRHVPLTVYNAKPLERDRIVAGLRSFIPAGLVLDVTVDGDSWNA